MGNTVINTNPIAYGTFTGYTTIFSGSRAMSFFVAGANTNQLIDTVFTLESNAYYSVFITDTLGSVEALLLQDIATTVEEGKAKVRVVHVSPDAPAVNVYTDTDTLFADVPAMFGTGFKEIAAGTSHLQFLTADTLSDTLVTLPAVQFLQGSFYTVVLHGFVNPPSDNQNFLDIDIINN